MAEKDSVQIKKKLTEALPQYKFSVTRDDFAGGHSVRVNVISGPMEVFSSSEAREDANGYVEIFRDRYKDDERINQAIKPDIDKMYKIIYDIGQFPSGYHGGPYLHWRFGSYSKPYEVVASKKSMPAPRAEKSSGETNADSELLMTFSQGWSLYKTTINKKDYDGKPITLVVYNLNKNKDLKNIPYDKFLEFKGEMLTSLNMKWGKFQKFEKWTYPVDTDILKVIIEKYYGVGESKEETPTPQPTPKSSKMTVKELADRLMTLDSTTWDRLNIESGSKLYADDTLQKKYIKSWTDFYESDTAIPTKMKELSMKERNELGDYFEDDNYHSLKNLLMLYGYFGKDNKVSAEQLYAISGYGLNPKNFKPEEEKLSFKRGDKFTVKPRTDKVFEIGLIAMGQVTIITPDMGEVSYSLTEVKQRFESGAWTKIDDKDSEFKVGDVYYSKTFKQNLTITEVEEDGITVKYQDDTEETYTPQYCRLNIQRKEWVKVVDEEKEIPFGVGDELLVVESGKTFIIKSISFDTVRVIYEDGQLGSYFPSQITNGLKEGNYKFVIDKEIEKGGSEEEIKKAIAALEILAEDGDEDARKGIEALKILLN